MEFQQISLEHFVFKGRTELFNFNFFNNQFFHIFMCWTRNHSSKEEVANYSLTFKNCIESMSYFLGVDINNNSSTLKYTCINMDEIIHRVDDIGP